ncbi:ATP-binding protein [bacterium]|nr:ATP-binding protein [bacterium]
MSEDILVQFITHGREERNLEYKSNINWKDPHIQAKLIKSILALSNIRNGGAIVIGVEQNGEKFTPKGLSNTNLQTFKQDDISSRVSSFADPYVEITVTHVDYEEASYVVIQVKEFAEIPVICKRDGAEGLTIGQIYTRPRRKIETVAIPSQIEMREIVNMAIDKGMELQQKRLSKYGSSSIDKNEADKAAFKNQAGDL